MSTLEKKITDMALKRIRRAMPEGDVARPLSQLPKKRGEFPCAKPVSPISSKYAL